MAENVAENDAPLLPTDEFVARFNLATPGARFRSALDPLVMMAWHLAAEPPQQPFVTGPPGC